VTIATDFSSANWCAIVHVENTDASIDADADVQTAMVALAGQAAGTLKMICGDSNGTIEEPTSWYMVGFGDQ
jgi:hypothetical protein